jgi:hypothetical protein
MKNVIIAILFLSLCSMIFYTCKYCNTTTEPVNPNSICTDFSYSPPNEMGKLEVIHMIRNYYNNQYNAMHNTINLRRMSFSQRSSTQFDTRAVFFSLDTIKKLLYYMEKASKGYSSADKLNLGVNIYFASYPDNKIQNGEDYYNKHTLIFMPSIFDPTINAPRDIDIAQNLFNGVSSSKQIDPSFFNDTLNPNAVINVLGNSYMRRSNNSGSNMQSQNNGTGTPPPPNSGDPLFDLTDPN